MPKNIVICCDGTRGQYEAEEKNTNIVRIFERLGPDSPDQRCYYDPGVGTYSPERLTVRRLAERAAMSMFGVGVWVNVLEAYRYLMTHYEKDDRVYLFGYSRGAHTVRVLAGLLTSCGLLTQGSTNLIPYMVRIYKGGESDIRERFKLSFARKCNPFFIGVFDTVASMGWAWRRRYYRNRRLSPDIDNAYQALSVDESRGHFQPSIWDETNIPDGQTIEQVWFPGRHVDVGGQDPPGRGISDIPLEWMLRNAERKGLLLRANWETDLRPDPLAPFKSSLATMLWGWAFPKKRTIEEKDKVHKSVIDRLSSNGLDYAPVLPDQFTVVK